MKKILILFIMLLNLHAVNYNTKVIGKIDPPWMSFSNLRIVCIDGVQYVMDTKDRGALMSPLYNRNGKIKTCK